MPWPAERPHSLPRNTHLILLGLFRNVGGEWLRGSEYLQAGSRGEGRNCNFGWLSPFKLPPCRCSPTLPFSPGLECPGKLELIKRN